MTPHELHEDPRGSRKTTPDQVERPRRTYPVGQPGHIAPGPSSLTNLPLPSVPRRPLALPAELSAAEIEAGKAPQQGVALPGAPALPGGPAVSTAGGPVLCTARELGQCSLECGVRCTGVFQQKRSAKPYWTAMAIFGAVAFISALGLLSIDNPMPFGSTGYWKIAELRASSVVVMLVVAVCQALATVSFQTVANNRILTPSILGFESVFVAIQTATIFVAGVTGIASANSLVDLFIRIGLMVVVSSILYGWLLSGRRGDVHTMLLVGIVLGGGLGALSTFMQRLLTPSEFDVLTASLFGNISNANTDHLVVVVPLVTLIAAVLYMRSHTLNVLGLGRESSTNLGLNFQAELRVTLMLVSVLMAVSTALVGPMTFLGFLVAMLTYQLAGTRDHRYLLPMAALLAFVVLAGASLIMRHVFYAAGAVTIIIELVGALAFLILLLRKGSL